MHCFKKKFVCMSFCDMKTSKTMPRQESFFLAPKVVLIIKYLKIINRYLSYFQVKIHGIATAALKRKSLTKMLSLKNICQKLRKLQDQLLHVQVKQSCLRYQFSSTSGFVVIILPLSFCIR